ncbi:CAAX prenyl protease-like protein [Tamaricihabitans halophyticus]|uniref:CAAX prenyl protease-like protein n=1 Tax=Tamaricihabitans halophyticus TaxID=1262583 RepID=A0A4R2RCJ0_9PSEU|nr:type II CAAX endopeptidase family protein [Tamaricihabitans halophyticus]TCP57145.1 CAAX prenyl protease-like protein [Tamaricihabitans halophyticus]
MTSRLRAWLAPERPVEPATLEDPRERRAIYLELVIVFTITLGLSGLSSVVSLVDSLLRTEALNEQSVAINRPGATLSILDLFSQLLSALRLFAWGALAVYLLWRSGIGLAKIGLGRIRIGRDAAAGVGFAALIGIPGLAFYLIAWQTGFNLAVQPSTLDESWWRPITLSVSAAGNAWAEQALVVGYLLTRLRQLGWRENTALLFAAILRGSYHLYQGFGGFIGNMIMGLVFGRVWQRTNRLWPLVIAHTLLDFIAFVGYSLLRDNISWLP